MKSSIRFIKTRIVISALAIAMAIMFSSFISPNVGALDLSNQIADLTDEDYYIYSANNIIFPIQDCINKGGSSSVCGDNAKEMYWSALSQYIDDPIKVAGIIGNLANEGGMNPVAWEGSITKSDGSLDYSWDFIYGGGLDGEKGVGAFGITSGLGTYLHYVNDNAPELLKYFQNGKEYNFNFIHPGSGANPTYGDTLIEKIGKDEFAKLVELEVKYAIEEFNPPRTQEYMEQKFLTPSSAAYWWMDEWERPGFRNPEDREKDAGKAYDELKDFTCTPKSSSVSSGNPTTGTNPGITLIGDSIAVQAEPELQSKFPGAFMSKVGSRHSTYKGACDIDQGGLDILKTIASGSGEVADYHPTSNDCYKLKVDANSLKENIVWELGTNSDNTIEDTEDAIKKVISLIGKRNLFLVTPYNGDNMSGADAIAEMYRKIAEENTNVYVVDWNKAVRDDEDTYITRADKMAVHPTQAGRQLLADLISEAVESTARCAIATYKHPAYKKRLEGLDTFNQWRGPWANHLMCPGDPSSSTMGDGCGVMSMLAMYYMFSGNGLNDEIVLNEFLNVTVQDRFNVCHASAGQNWGEASEAYTKMDMNPEDAFWNGRNYRDSDWDTLVDALKQGKKILIGTTGSDCGGPSMFGYCGHYIFFDHYNAEKDAIYLFDPSMSSTRAGYATEYGPTGDFYDGVYIDRETMAKYVVPDEARPVTYYGQDCMVCEENEAGLIAGGMTYEQAVEFIQPYVDEASKTREGDYGVGSPWGSVIGNGWIYDAGCKGGTLNNCVALSQWFINNYTTAGPSVSTTDGWEYVDYLVNLGIFEYGDRIPRPYAIFSQISDNHTGIVLGINKEKNEMYIAEAGCGAGFIGGKDGWPGVKIWDLAASTNGDYKYAYTDGKLKYGSEANKMLKTL